MSTSAEYRYSGGDLNITDQMKHDFNQYGYIMVRNLLDAEELERIKSALENNSALIQHSFKVDDGDGGLARMCNWGHPGSDITGMLARCNKVVNTCEELLGGEVYHYHSKLMMKDAHTGGKHVWHQDYGYWYKNGNLFPDMMTVFIAVDKSMKENGCLQILRGSNTCGRIEHNFVAGQTGADVERVNAIAKVCPLEHAEMEPGDALFFHCNLLHTSNQNRSPYRRWAFLCAYNRVSNNPIKKHHHPQYTKLYKVPNSAIRECTNFTDMTGKDFLDPTKSTTMKYEGKK